MIYRITAESVFAETDESTGGTRYVRTASGARGIFRAGFGCGFGDLKLCWIEHPRARFYFTELGWQTYGVKVAAAAAEHGINLRVRREKNPARSRIVYQDKFQVVLLPNREKAR